MSWLAWWAVKITIITFITPADCLEVSVCACLCVCDGAVVGGWRDTWHQIALPSPFTNLQQLLLSLRYGAEGKRFDFTNNIRPPSVT